MSEINAKTRNWLAGKGPGIALFERRGRDLLTELGLSQRQIKSLEVPALVPKILAALKGDSGGGGLGFDLRSWYSVFTGLPQVDEDARCPQYRWAATSECQTFACIAGHICLVKGLEPMRENSPHSDACLYEGRATRYAALALLIWSATYPETQVDYLMCCLHHPVIAAPEIQKLSAGQHEITMEGLEKFLYAVSKGKKAADALVG